MCRLSTEYAVFPLREGNDLLDDPRCVGVWVVCGGTHVSCWWV